MGNQQTSTFQQKFKVQVIIGRLEWHVLASWEGIARKALVGAQLKPQSSLTYLFPASLPPSISSPLLFHPWEIVCWDAFTSRGGREHVLAALSSRRQGKNLSNLVKMWGVQWGKRVCRWKKNKYSCAVIASWIHPGGDGKMRSEESKFHSRVFHCVNYFVSYWGQSDFYSGSRQWWQWSGMRWRCSSGTSSHLTLLWRLKVHFSEQVSLKLLQYLKTLPWSSPSHSSACRLGRHCSWAWWNGKYTLDCNKIKLFPVLSVNIP